MGAIVKSLLIFVSLFLLINYANCKKFKEDHKPDWAKKDIRDYSEADLERLLDQWEEDEDPLPEDELPEYLREKPKMEFDPSNIQNPEELLRKSKKHQTIMMFVSVKDHLTSSQADDVTKIWQSALWNNHIQAERYMIDEHRAIFMFKDGSQAWDARDYLIEQEDLAQCTLENQVFFGKHTPEGKNGGTVTASNIKEKVEL